MIANFAGKSAPSISNLLCFAKVVCKYNPTTKRHERGDLFKYWVAQETFAGKPSLIPPSLMFRWMCVKRAKTDIVLEFVRNYFMPVGKGAGKGIIPMPGHDFSQMTLDYDWDTFKPMTGDLSDAGFAPYYSGAKQLSVTKVYLHLFLLWQVRLVFSSVLTHAWAKQKQLAEAALGQGHLHTSPTHPHTYIPAYLRNVPLSDPMSDIGSKLIVSRQFHAHPNTCRRTGSREVQCALPHRRPQPSGVRRGHGQMGRRSHDEVSHF